MANHAVVARIALLGAAIYADPLAEPVRDGAVVLDGPAIAAAGPRACVSVPNDAEVIDCAGCVVTAGFWNSHVHFFERKWANAGSMPAAELERQLRDTFTRYGCTSAFDTGSMWENTRAIRDRIDAGEVRGPKIRSTGEALVPPGAMPEAHVLAALGYVNFPAPEITDAAQASRAAQRLLAAGADGIKLFPSSPRGARIPDDAIAAAAAQARRAGKPVFAHPESAADIAAAIRSGVSVVAHTTPRSGAWDADMLASMLERDVALTPTLALWKTLLRHDRDSVRDQTVATAVDQLRAWHAAGGRVLFGTDLGAADADPGDEYDLMSQAGMDFRAILASLTTAPAEHFGEGERAGRIARGYAADIVVLRGDPAAGLQALRAVQYTLRAGKVVYRAAGLAAR